MATVTLQTFAGVRFASTLRYIELPCELVTTPVLHELANKCQVSLVVSIPDCRIRHCSIVFVLVNVVEFEVHDA